MQCATHPDATANGICSYSGKPFCGDCLIEIEGKLYGKPYLDRVMADARDHAGSKTHTPMVFMNAGGAAAVASSSALAAPTGPMVVAIGLREVPFYRKRWFVILMCLTIAPIAFISAVTGPLYSNNGGEWMRVSGGGKAAYIILSLWGCGVIIAAL
jgi:hypothetical protein